MYNLSYVCIISINMSIESLPAPTKPKTPENEDTVLSPEGYYSEDTAKEAIESMHQHRAKSRNSEITDLEITSIERPDSQWHALRSSLSAHALQVVSNFEREHEETL